jgi:hypothetical protein
MTITVYYAVWGDPKLYGNSFLSYRDPYRLLEDTKSKKNVENKGDNFLLCPAFVNSIKNTYVFSSPLDIDCTFEPNGAIVNKIVFIVFMSRYQTYSTKRLNQQPKIFSKLF